MSLNAKIQSAIHTCLSNYLFFTNAEKGFREISEVYESESFEIGFETQDMSIARKPVYTLTKKPEALNTELISLIHEQGREVIKANQGRVFLIEVGGLEFLTLGGLLLDSFSLSPFTSAFSSFNLEELQELDVKVSLVDVTN